MQKTYKTSLATEAALMQFGARLAKQLPVGGAIIYLQGELGAGKTSLVRGIMRGLGYTARVKSPTYTLVEPYEQGNYAIYHFDLYRLTHADELRSIGIEEYFHPGAICFIEWAEKGYPWLPPPDLNCVILIEEERRIIELQSQSVVGEHIVTNL